MERDHTNSNGNGRQSSCMMLHDMHAGVHKSHHFAAYWCYIRAYMETSWKQHKAQPWDGELWRFGTKVWNMKKHIGSIWIYWIIIQLNIRTYAIEWCSTSTYINIDQLNLQYIYGCKNLLSIPVPKAISDAATSQAVPWSWSQRSTFWGALHVTRSK